MSFKDPLTKPSKTITAMRQHNLKENLNIFKNHLIKQYARLRANLLRTIDAVWHSVWLKYFLAFTIIYLIALVPLFRANYNYIDDTGRGHSGYSDFGFSRTTSDQLSSIINDGDYLTDLSPFTQILAIILIAFASTLAIKFITGSIKKTPTRVNFWYIVATLPIALQPYYLENFSYKFDAPYMALSILVSIMPFWFYRATKKWRNYAFLAIGIISTIIMCTTYQASSGIFPAMAIVLAFASFLNKRPVRDLARFISLAIIAYGIGILYFRLFIMESVSGYVDNSIWPIAEIIPGTFHNYLDFAYLFWSDMRRRWLAVIAVILLGFIATSVIRTKQKRLITGLVAVCTLIAILALSFGMYPVMTQPLAAPRAMYGIFVNLALISILTVSYQYSYLSKLGATYLAYAFIILACTYGNAVNIQKQYEAYRIQLLVGDLNDIAVTQPIYVRLEGTAGHSEIVQRLSQKYAVLRRLIPTMFGTDNRYWGIKQMTHYYPLPGVHETDLIPEKAPLVKTTRTHDIYRQGELVIVKLKTELPSEPAPADSTLL